MQRQEGGDTPYGLVVMSALLVKHAFVSLSDLLAFVGRTLFIAGLLVDLACNSFHPTTIK